MPLPKINTPTYDLTLPSGKKIKYRPFLVREEKILIMALETEDMKQITSAVMDILNSCIVSKNLKIELLPSFDIEFLFLHVRSKSVGETIEVNITCPDDNETTVPVKIDIDTIKIKKTKKHTNIIKLDDKLSIKLKYPSMKSFVRDNFEFDPNDNEVNSSLNLIISCIESIFNDEECWNASEQTDKELQEFIEQLNTKQFKEIENYFTSMPKLEHKVKVKNPNTGVESEVVLEGLASFFN